ncbi:MAG: hypothetical protein ABGX16_16455 [Pirellulales bacterium]
MALLAYTIMDTETCQYWADVGGVERLVTDAKKVHEFRPKQLQSLNTIGRLFRYLPIANQLAIIPLNHLPSNACHHAVIQGVRMVMA